MIDSNTEAALPHWTVQRDVLDNIPRNTAQMALWWYWFTFRMTMTDDQRKGETEWYSVCIDYIACVLVVKRSTEWDKWCNVTMSKQTILITQVGRWTWHPEHVTWGVEGSERECLWPMSESINDWEYPLEGGSGPPRLYVACQIENWVEDNDKRGVIVVIVCPWIFERRHVRRSLVDTRTSLVTNINLHF